MPKPHFLKNVMDIQDPKARLCYHLALLQKADIA